MVEGDWWGMNGGCGRMCGVEREGRMRVEWWFVFLIRCIIKLFSRLEFIIYFFISLSHLCFAGQFVFYVNLNVFRYEIR